MKAGALQYNKFPDLDLKQNVGGISLFIHQQKRDLEKGLINHFCYDNDGEFNYVKMLVYNNREYLESCRNNLKLNAPDLLFAVIDFDFKKEYTREPRVR